jgi:uncharacterized cupin superfamily protein
LRYLALSTLAEVEVCEYPDSGKVGIWTEAGLKAGFRMTDRAEYYDGEDT